MQISGCPAKALGSITRWLFPAAIFLSLILTPVILQAQVSTHFSYEETINRSRNFAALDENLFGDKVDLQEGRLSFAQDDIVLKTNGELTVSIGRKTPSSDQGLDEAYAIFGIDWEPNIPFMMGSFDTRHGWNAGGSMNRCSAGFAPKETTGPWPYYHTMPMKAHLWWHGITINIPQRGEEKLLRSNSDQTLPTDGKTYTGTTKSAWRVSCLPTIKNGDGEGFAVTLPDGTIYYFDWMASRNAIDLTSGSCTLDANGDCNDSWHRLVPRTDIFLYATKAVDRFGNTVTYSFDPNRPNRINSIASSDGVRIDIDYNTNGQISAARANGKQWSYAYVAAINGYHRLSTLTLPDSSKWSFASEGWPNTHAGIFWSHECRMDPGSMRSDVQPDPSHIQTISMTHPSGARGEFQLRKIFHGTNNTPGGCGLFGSQETSLRYGTYGVPAAYVVNSLFRKKIYGPGISDMTWDYIYRPSWSFDASHGSMNGLCSSPCPATSETEVLETDGTRRRYIFGNSFHTNQGQLLSDSIIRNGSTLKSTSYSYVASSSGYPFPDSAGDIPTGSGVSYDGINHYYNYGNPFTYKHRPQKTRSIQQDGASFTRTANSFDPFARSVSVTRSSSLGHSRTEVTGFHDNLNRWVLGQQATLAINGIAAQETTYDSLARPISHKAFGKLQHTLGYHADGTLASYVDGHNQVTMLSNWYRGVPRNIAYPDGTGVSAIVNPDGTLASVTDENGFTTCYAYDAMGRLSQITYPSESQSGICDTSAWHPTSQVLEPVAATEHGLGPGHWRQTVATGAARKVSYFDGLWRPVLTHEYDLNDVAGTQRYVRMAYDHAGRTTFASYPGAVPGLTSGTWTEYDALGRTTSVSQDSEHGLLTTRTEYLPGLLTRVTNPRGLSTVTRYQAWDQPGYDQPVRIDAPEQSVTTILRDVFGKPLEIRRSAAP